jgi:2-C-methyl-D-erythritol 2,4-cyclodiphosphate synthase
MRIGQGYDVHPFCEGDHVIIGGVRIPHTLGIKAHSDGDVLIHALCDALLGAAALGDIGQHFPDTDQTYWGADSRVLLRAVVNVLKNQGYRVANVDSTVIAQTPKLAPHIEGMRKNLAQDLGVAIDLVSVKATTTERLGFTGRKEGIAAQSVVMITSSKMGNM